MSKTMNGISRRLFLGGAGAAVALPFLRSLLPRAARAEAAPGLQRIIVFYVPVGIHMENWTPAAEGAGYELTPILAPLAPVKDKVLVASGLNNVPALPDGAGGHAAGTGGFLTCTHVVKSETTIRAAVSMDQLAAQRLGASTRFPSLQLGTDGGTGGGNCDNGYGCAYVRNISWSGPTSPMPKLTRAQAMFDLLFAGHDPNASAAEAARRAAYQASVLDSVIDDAESVRGKLGATDQDKLDEYLTGVRELEQRLQQPRPACEVGARPVNGSDFATITRQIIDVMVLAVQCDATRVMTFMMGNGGDDRSFPFLGISDGHHQLSHHQGTDYPGKLTAIDTWEVEQLSYFAQKLAAVDDGDGKTALDNSLVYFSSEIADGNKHNQDNLPIVIVGGGGGVKTGRHARWQDQPVANLYTSMLRSVGVDIDRFGDNGTGPLDDFQL